MRRLVKVSLFHAVFASYGEMANVMNFMAVPVRHFFAESLTAHYNISPSGSASQLFELVYSGVSSLLFVGGLVGVFVLGPLMDNYGRKATAIIIRSTLGVLAPGLMILGKWLNSVELFALGQLIVGVVGALKVVLFIYMSECSPDDSRAMTVMIIGAGGNIMLLFAALLSLPSTFANDHDWTVLPAVCFVFALLHLLIGWLALPESPKHLFIAGKEPQRAEAEQSVLFYHGDCADLASVLGEFERERALAHNYKEESASLRELFTDPTLRWILFIVMVAALVPTVSLTTLKLHYLQPMLMSFGLSQAQSMVSTMAMTFITAPLSVLAPWLVERFGRRPLFLAVSAVSTAELVLVAATQALVDWSGGGRGWFVPPLGLVGLSLGNAAGMLGLFTMSPILIGEFCPHAARAVTTQFYQIAVMPLAIALVVVYPVVTASYGALVVLLPVVGASCLLLYLMYTYLPETKGMPVDRIIRHLSTRTHSVLEQQRHGIPFNASIANALLDGGGYVEDGLLQISTQSKRDRPILLSNNLSFASPTGVSPHRRLRVGARGRR